MKKAIFILIILVSYTSNIFSQEDYFPKSNAIWNIHKYYSDHGPYATPEYDNFRDIERYGLMGDTLINDTLYNKLYLLSDSILSEDKLKRYIGGFRQEDKKVWFRPKYGGYTNEFLLYDFGAEVGDTIWHNVSLSNEVYFEKDENFVSIIQEKQKENGKDKYFVKTGILDENLNYFGKSKSNFWIQGVGSNLGLFWQLYYKYPLSWGHYDRLLACFKHNGKVKYLNNKQCNKCFCYGSTGITDNKIEQPDWACIFLDNTQKLLNIEISKPYSNIMVEIINETGIVVYKENSLVGSIKLNNSFHGIYLVKLTVDNEVLVEKIMVK